MKQLLMVLFFVVSSGSICFAQQAKVIKVKGQQAIVQFPAGVTPQVGQVLSTGEDASGGENRSSGSGGDASRGRRKYSIGGSAALSYINNSQTSKSTLSLGLVEARVGWNMVQYEAGPFGTLTYASVDSLSTRKILIGGFYDYNLVPNKPGTELVYGVSSQLGIGQTATSAGAVDSSDTLLEFFVGGFGKWFILKNTTAIRLDSGLSYERTAKTSSTISETGFITTAGLQVYF